MLSARRKDKAVKREIPEWKRLLLEQDNPAAAASSSTGPGTGLKRPREEEEPIAAPASSQDAAAAPAEEDSDPLPAVDDDDDDDDVDLSAYDLGGGDEEEEEISAAPAYQPTREELLLMREARDAGAKSRKTYFVDDDQVHGWPLHLAAILVTHWVGCPRGASVR